MPGAQPRLLRHFRRARTLCCQCDVSLHLGHRGPEQVGVVRVEGGKGDHKGVMLALLLNPGRGQSCLGTSTWPVGASTKCHSSREGKQTVLVPGIPGAVGLSPATLPPCLPTPPPHCGEPLHFGLRSLWPQFCPLIAHFPPSTPTQEPPWDPLVSTFLSALQLAMDCGSYQGRASQEAWGWGWG